MVFKLNFETLINLFDVGYIGTTMEGGSIMRIEIKLRPAEVGTILPFNYNYEVYSQLLEKVYLVSPELGKELNLVVLTTSRSQG